MGIIDLFVLLFICVALLDFFASRHLIEALRNRLLDYWLFIEELTVSEELSRHVKTVRRFLTAYARMFCLGSILFGAVLINVAAASYKYVRDSRSLVQSYLDNSFPEALIEHYLGAQTSGAVFEIFGVEPDAEAVGSILEGCEQSKTPSERCKTLLSRIEKFRQDNEVRLQRYDTLKHEGHSVLGKQIVLAIFYCTLINAVFYLVSFLLSIWVTLQLLSAMEAVRLRSILFLICDLVLAVIIPVAILAVVASVLTFFVSARYVGFLNDPYDVDFAYRFTPFFVGAYFDARLMALSSSVNYLASLLELAKLPGTELYNVIYGTYFWAQWQLLDFLADVYKVLRGKASTIHVEAAQRNWTIFLSIAFSLTYIFVVAFLMLAKRSKSFRYVVNRVLQYLVEHPRGPLGAISLLLAGAAVLIRLYR